MYPEHSASQNFLIPRAPYSVIERTKFKFRVYLTQMLQITLGVGRKGVVHIFARFGSRSLVAGVQGSVLLVLYLGGEVVADVTDVSDAVLHHQGHVGRHGQGHL
jgi:hypothetical protein